MATQLENELVRFGVDVAANAWELEDLRAGVRWGSAGDPGPWVSWRGVDDAEATPLVVREAREEEGALRCRLGGATGDDGHIEIVFRLAGNAVQAYVLAGAANAGGVLGIFGRGLTASASEAGDALAPVRMGLLIPAAGDETFTLDLDTYAYEGVHMAMAGLLKGGAALMATWGDPYVRLHLEREILNGAGRLRLSFALAKTARSLEIACLGPGDLTTLAEAYRERARALGYRLTWDEKLIDRPQAAGLFGASNVKLWHALARRIDADLREVSVTVNWTFDEVAQVAEHLKQEVQIDQVLFHLGGWTRYGYDVRHPDIMPANPECGGNEGLADCARRVQALGYLFCLHDNYQDMYRDAPSWDEAVLQKDADGSPHKGGVWLGGQAYYTCSREALKLAMRPQNLPLVQTTFAPDVYFIDTTYAVGPQECYDPRHPLTRQEDIAWKQALSDYARGVFGLFGSECGREWAVPHADFFEGLASVSGRYYHQLDPASFGARVVPFFDMVFHDCIAIHGKYGYQPTEMAEQVIHHAAMGRTLYYHALGPRLYWKDEDGAAGAPRAEAAYDPALYTRAHNGWAAGMHIWDRFIKNTHEILSPLYARTARALIGRYEFLDTDRLVRRTTFANGVTVLVNGGATDYGSASSLGDVVLPPYGLLVEAGSFAALVVTAWDGERYDGPVLFTLTSLDGMPVVQSRKVRVFHGFGDARLLWGGAVAEVQREAVLERS